MSLTDEICRELLDGLEKGLDWEHYLARYSASKGPLYNALARFFTEAKSKIVTLNDEKRRVQTELNQAELTLDSLDRKIKEAEGSLTSLENRRDALNEQIETHEAKLVRVSLLLESAEELAKLGFDIDRMRQLRETLTEIGVKNGLKGKEAVGKFFDDLKDYESVLETEALLDGLQTQIETKKIEAENWQAKEEMTRRKHDDLKEAIDAVHTFRTKGIKVSQIIAWHQVLNRFQTVEQFGQTLAQYGDITKLLHKREKETESRELRLAKVQSQVETLEKEKARIEGAIDAIKAVGIQELKKMTQEAEKQLKATVLSELKEIHAAGREAMEQFNDYSNKVDRLVENAFQTGQKFERMKQELQKYDAVKEVLESHVVATEAAK